MYMYDTIITKNKVHYMMEFDFKLSEGMIIWGIENIVKPNFFACFTIYARDYNHK